MNNYEVALLFFLLSFVQFLIVRSGAKKNDIDAKQWLISMFIGFQMSIIISIILHNYMFLWLSPVVAYLLIKYLKRVRKKAIIKRQKYADNLYKKCMNHLKQN